MRRRSGTGCTSCRGLQARWSCSTAPRSPFSKSVAEITGHPVAVFQRIDQAGYKLPIDERVLEDTDTLMVFGLDHLVSEQEASPEEIECIREWLKREGTCLMLGPHHDVGFSDDMKQRQMEYAHHGDALVPRQQRFGQYTRSLMKALGVPVMNQFGLRPALVKGTKQIAPLSINKDLDKIGLLNGVTTFNFHPHLPHYAVTTDDAKSVHVLTRQPIDLDRPHPFTAAGNTEFNSCVWMPPGTNAPDISCLPTRRSSRRCSAGRIAWRRSGKTSPGYEALTCRRPSAPCSPVEAWMEFLSKIIPVTLLVFVVSSMLAVGLSLTVREILVPLRNRRLVSLALLANFVLMPLAALVIARLLRLDAAAGRRIAVAWHGGRRAVSPEVSSCRQR